MHPETLISGFVAELWDCMDATPLECMLVTLLCPIMCVVWHKVAF